MQPETSSAAASAGSAILDTRGSSLRADGGDGSAGLERQSSQADCLV
jgi:hypothetical protein